MKISRYRLTPLGWLGAALFVLPTPVAVWTSIPPRIDPGTAMFQDRLRDLGGAVEVQGPSVMLLAILATASLVGLVLLLIGRELVTTDQ